MINFLLRYYEYIGIGLIIGMFGNPINLTFTLSVIFLAGIYLPIIVSDRILCSVNGINMYFHLKTTLVGITMILASVVVGYCFVVKLLL